MTIPWSRRLRFFKPGLWDCDGRLGSKIYLEKNAKNRSVRPWYGHWRLGSKMCLKKKWKKPVYETMVWSLADRVKNLIEKQWPGLSDSDIVTGGLRGYFEISENKILISDTKCSCSPFDFDVRQNISRTKFVQFPRYYSFLWLIFFFFKNLVTLTSEFGIVCL